MSSAISVLQKQHWLVLTAVLVLVVVVLTAGTLFAANERRQSDPSTVNQQSVADVTNPALAAKVPSVPPAPERIFAQPEDNDQEETDLPRLSRRRPVIPT